jgi:hypothetical protein
MPTTTTATRPAFVACYDGRILLGLIYRRVNRFEAVTTKRRSLGHYPSQREAADALCSAATPAMEAAE